MADQALSSTPPPDLAGRITQLGEALAASQGRLAEEVTARRALAEALRAALIARAAAAAQARMFASLLRTRGLGPWKTLAVRRPRRGFDPGPLFDLGHYLVQGAGPDAGEDPIAHYLRIGWTLGLSPHPLFEPAWYAAQATIEGPPLVHYLTTGWRQGLSPHPLVDPAWCLERSPDLAQAGVEPLTHYLTHGAAEGRDPGPWFATGRYVAQRGEGLPAGRNPLVDYLQGGAWAVCESEDLIFAVDGVTPLERWARNAGPRHHG